MADYNRILLLGEPIRKEYAAGGDVTPGHLVRLNSSGQIVAHSGAGANAQRLFAIENDLAGDGIDTAYESGDRAQCVVCPRGTEIYALLADGENVSVGDFLESAGDGTLRKHEADSAGVVEFPEAVVAVALEALDISASGNAEAGRIRVEIV